MSSATITEVSRDTSTISRTVRDRLDRDTWAQQSTTYRPSSHLDHEAIVRRTDELAAELTRARHRATTAAELQETEAAR